ncbi:MAG TPA: NUDIX domain-containing protein [Chloroflexota bacterium]|nr:NUDIX domain-containing protein [Chloroflexota bacterium]
MAYLEWLRQRVGTRQVLLVYTSVVVEDGHGRVLWQHRTDFDSWGLPGGVLELEESLPACAVREVLEETGLHVTPTRVVGVYSSPDFNVTYPNGDQAQQVSFCFACRVEGGTLQADGHEGYALQWLPATACPPTQPWYQAMLADYNAHQSFASFDRGAPGNSRPNVPYYQFLRPYIGQAPYIMAGTAAFIQNEAGHILLQQRRDNGLWCFPGGGVELGERVDQAIVQEVWEETGLQVQPTHVIGVYSDPVDWITYANGDQVKIARTFFACRIIGGHLQADAIESLDARFFAPNALPEIIAPHGRPLQDALANYPYTVF